MVRIIVPAGNRQLPFYLAIEEWVALNLPPDDYFFIWSVEPTVIFGRNQNIATEVDLEYCRDHGIRVFRRKSGGGCVYADSGNLMISYITPATQVSNTFSKFTSMLSEALSDLGLDSSVSGRNDVCISGRKVSGAAFYHLPGRSVVHSTLLHSVDFMQNMLNAITPSKSKLQSKQVQSVESRITTVGEHLPDMSIEALREHINNKLTTSVYTLTPEDIAQVEEIEAPYYALKWIFGRRGLLASPKNSLRVLRRVEGVGEMDMFITLDDLGVITDVDLTGDFFLISDLDTSLLNHLKNVNFDEAAVRRALESVDVSQVIANLSAEQFIEFMFSGKSRRPGGACYPNPLSSGKSDPS